MCGQLVLQVEKCQMQAVTGKVNVAVRKHKTGGNIYTAGQLRDADSINNLIKFDDGYRVLKDLRGSPPYWEKAKRDLYAIEYPYARKGYLAFSGCWEM